MALMAIMGWGSDDCFAKPFDRLRLRNIIFVAAIRENVPPLLLSAICYVESTYRPKVINKKDPSYGLCQLKLDTARMFSYDGGEQGLLDPHINARYAAKYLSYLLKRYKGDVLKATSAYNCGRFCRNYSYINKVMGALVERR